MLLQLHPESRTVAARAEQAAVRYFVAPWGSPSFERRGQEQQEVTVLTASNLGHLQH